MKKQGNYFKMPIEKIFPTILIIIDILAGLIYLYQSDKKHFIYWLSAACLTFSVTWL